MRLRSDTALMQGHERKVASNPHVNCTYAWAWTIVADDRACSCADSNKSYRKQLGMCLTRISPELQEYEPSNPGYQV